MVYVTVVSWPQLVLADGRGAPDRRPIEPAEVANLVAYLSTPVNPHGSTSQPSRSSHDAGLRRLQHRERARRTPGALRLGDIALGAYYAGR